MKNCMFLVTLFICALTDIVTYRIRNSVLVVSAVMLLLFELLISSEGSAAADLVSAGTVLVILFPFYLMGLIAAGDVKLLALSAMYLGTTALCSIVPGAIAASIVLAFIISVSRHEPIIKTRYPFAFALFLGAYPLWFQA
ncbi:MAG: prepilin peptidase [Lachnospiraceae bacterium]|nr:prepilin peptidase [Lachnospiraceae bacterium]